MSKIKVNLDFYNHTTTTIHAKQHDTFARHINITCTDRGKKVDLNKIDTSVYMGVHKENGEYEFEHVDVLSDGTVDVTLTETVLASAGKCYADIIIFGKKGLTVDDIEQIYSMENLDTYVLSTMPICINVIGNAVPYEKLQQSKNYNGLLYAISLAENLDVVVRQNEKERQDKELERQGNETSRSNIFSSKIDLCEQATDGANDAKDKAESATSDAQKATQDVEDALKNYNEKIDDMEKAIEKCDSSTSRANTAASKCEGIVDGSGIVMQDEKGIANGVATLDENKQIPLSQLGNIHKIIYPSINIPSDDEGKDGDICVVIIE